MKDTSARDLDLEIFVGARELARRRFALARDFRRLAERYVKLTHEALDEALAAARRLGVEMREEPDEFDLKVPEIFDAMESRDKRGAA
jgi:hypothetical protein